MGKTINSICGTCRFKSQFNFGGSRADFHKNKPVPAINLKTGEFENVNFFIHKANPGYLFYSDGLLKSTSENQTTFDDFDFQINTKSNYCPNCKNFSLDFECIGYFD